MVLHWNHCPPYFIFQEKSLLCHPLYQPIKIHVLIDTQLSSIKALSGGFSASNLPGKLPNAKDSGLLSQSVSKYTLKWHFLRVLSHNDTCQGCPFSLLPYILVLEQLTEALRSDNTIKRVQAGNYWLFSLMTFFLLSPNHPSVCLMLWPNWND